MSLRMDAGFEHLRQAMAQIFAEEIEFPLGAFVTLLRAKMTANTAHASFTLSVMPVSMEEEVLETLERHNHELKDALAKHLRLRRIPRLHFGFDHTEEKAAVIEETLNHLRANGEM
ncbi:ribosome-binding factor A [Patescibacteria group bacterium]|nr:ribosome-binding factor A [Patescibacteria group bacterium]